MVDVPFTDRIAAKFNTVMSRVSRIPESWIIQQYGRYALEFLFGKGMLKSDYLRIPIVYSRSEDRWTATQSPDHIRSCLTSEVDESICSRMAFWHAISFILRTFVRTNVYPPFVASTWIHEPFDYYELPSDIENAECIGSDFWRYMTRELIPAIAKLLDLK
jgi:hypothetical protein